MQRIILSAVVCVLVIGATLFRVLVIEETRLEADLQGDSIDYFMYAYNLSNVDVYSKSRKLHGSGRSVTPDAERPPFFPLVASTWISTGERAELKRVYYFNLWIQSAALLLLAVILVVKLDSRWSLVPIAMISFQPHLANMTAYFLTESLFTSLLVFSFFWVFLYERRNIFSAIVLAGACIGLASITRGSMQFFWFFLLLFALILRHENRLIAGFIAGSLAPILGWEVYKLLYIPDSGNIQAIATVYHGHFPGFRFGGIEESFGFAYRYDPLRDHAMASLSNTLEVIWLRFKQDPLAYLYWYTIGKQTHLWQWSIIGGHGGIFVFPPVESPFLGRKFFEAIVTISYYLHWPVVAAGLGGMVLALTRILKREVRTFSVYGFSALVLVYFVLIHTLAAPYPRYSIPLYPFLMVMCCYSIRELWILVRNNKSRLLAWRH